MNVPQGVVKLDVRLLQLVDSLEIASILLRREGREEDAVSLFRLRIKIREGLSYENAKPIFDKHTKSLLGEK
jgi:hypothetical protein